MTEAQQQFDQLMQRVRAGCSEAAREVFDLYSPHIRRIVRRKLHQRLRTQYDSLDFLQAVWASFFLTPAQQYTFATPEELIEFLSSVAMHKVIDAYRRSMQTRKRNLRRESLMTDLGEALNIEPRAVGPTPSQVVGDKERWDQLVSSQTPELRVILELLREGHTHREIAERSGLHPKAVQRMLRQFYDNGEPSA